VVWTLVGERQGMFESFLSEPIRPTKAGTISIWLRASTTLTEDYPFRADFDDFSLKRVKTNIE
jgi:hypothetical protein